MISDIQYIYYCWKSVEFCFIFTGPPRGPPGGGYRGGGGGGGGGMRGGYRGKTCHPKPFIFNTLK